MATKKTTKAKAPAKAATKRPAAKKAKADNNLRLTSASPSFTVNADQDIDKLAARIKANGGTLEGPRDTRWGTRELAVDDPDGYKITIAKETRKR